MAKLQQGKTSQKTELYRKVFSTVSLSISARRPLSAKHEAHLSVGDCTGHPSSEWSSEGTGELSQGREDFSLTKLQWNKKCKIPRKIPAKLKQRAREEKIKPVEGWTHVTLPARCLSYVLLSCTQHGSHSCFSWSENLGNKLLHQFKDPGEVLQDGIFCALRCYRNLTGFVVMFNWDLFSVSWLLIRISHHWKMCKVYKERHCLLCLTNDIISLLPSNP